jgi:hypothetical protein
MFQTIIVLFHSQQTKAKAFFTLFDIAEEQSLRWGGCYCGSGGDSPDHEDIAYAFNTLEAAEQWVACVKTSAATAGVVLDYIGIVCEQPGAVEPDHLRQPPSAKVRALFRSLLGRKSK